MRASTYRLTFLSVLLAAGNVAASSHREAPAIAQDPMADNTDVYAFVSPSNPDNVVLVSNSVPLLIPSSGPNFYGFGDDVAYEICIDNDGDAIRDICYQWRFQTEIANGATFLYNTGPIASIGDSALNVRQSYDLIRYDYNGSRRTRRVVADDVPVAPWNVGSRSFPGNYEAVAGEAVYSNGDMSVFAGPRDEPFFVDLHVFDLLGVGGAPTTDGLNVMSLVLEVPIADISSDGVRPSDDELGPTSVMGVYARNLRRVVEIRRRRGPAQQFGRFVQVSRLAVPLVNEVVIPLQDKDNFNRSSPHNDVSNFGAYILDPELNGLLSAVLGLPCPPTPSDGRLDIVGILSPSGTTPADLLRLDIREGQTFSDSAFPNGRSLEDDVTDVLLTLICSGDFSVAVGDGVDGNDLPFGSAFPYLASPHSGNPAAP